MVALQMTTPEEPQSIGKYKIVGPLGKGSMGVVFKAIDPEIGRVVAVKTLRRLNERGKAFDGSDAALERFRNEARSAGNLRHPNIITVFEVKVNEDLPYIVMDYVEGESLQQMILKRGKLPPALFLTLLAQIASAIDYAHARGVIHRDIKCSNIVIDRNNTAFILDFGVASISRSYSDWEMPLTQAPVVGTPGFMSPEQLLNEQVDHRADLFSLAVVAFECLTGSRPFPGNDFATVVNNTLSAKPVSLTSLSPELPLALEAEIEKCLSKEKKLRFYSAQEFAAACARALGMEITNAVPVSSSGRVALKEVPANSERNAPGGAERRSSTASQEILLPALIDEPNTVGGAPYPLTRGASATSALSSGWGTSSSGRRTVNGPFGSTPGSIFVHGDNQSEGLGGAHDDLAGRFTQRTNLSYLPVLVVLLCVGIGYVLFLPAPQESLPTVPAAVVQALSHGRVAQSDAPAPDAALGPLTDPAVEKAPLGKDLRALNDRELLGVIKDHETPEVIMIDAIKEADRRGLPQLVDISVWPLQSDSYVVRVEILKILALRKDRRIVPHVIPQLDDPDPIVRRYAAQALGAMGDQRALGYLSARLIKEESEEVKSVLRQAVDQVNISKRPVK